IFSGFCPTTAAGRAPHTEGKRRCHLKKGKSGNPGGGTKVVGVQALARGAPRAVETLRGIMENIKAPPAARIAAAVAILDRGFGRPHQMSEIVTVQKPVSEMSDDELIARIREFDGDGGTPSH